MLVFTKADKQGVSVTQHHVELFQEEMMKTWDTLPKVFITSAETKTGREEILKSVAQMIEAYKTQAS